MKKTLVKSAAFVLVASSLFFIPFSCSKQAETSGLNSKELAKTAGILPEDNPFKRTVGAPISKQTSKQWVENFNRVNGLKEGRFYLMDRDALQAILTDPACVGISLHYGVDGYGNYHVLPIGVNGDGKLIRVGAISTQSGWVDWDRAQQWIANHSGLVQSHFFGRNTFERLFSMPCVGVWAMFALNDEGQPQLVLSRKQDGELSPNFALPDDDQDRSSVCPPVCH